MEDLMNLIIGDSTTLDIFVIVRIIIVSYALEMFAVACGLISGMKGR